MLSLIDAQKAISSVEALPDRDPFARIVFAVLFFGAGFFTVGVGFATTSPPFPCGVKPAAPLLAESTNEASNSSVETIATLVLKAKPSLIAHLTDL